MRAERRTLLTLAVLFSITSMIILSLQSKANAGAEDYTYLKVKSRSMEPTLPEGTMITVRTDVNATQIPVGSYPNGSIIVFHRPRVDSAEADVLVVHRAVNTTLHNSLIYFSTKGDGQPTGDSWSPDYRGEDYSWNGMISERLLVGKVISWSNNFYTGTARTLGRYALYRDTFWITQNKTIQQLRDEGYEVSGDPTWLSQANYTRLGYTIKATVVKSSFPVVTTRITAGRYDLNTTVYRIQANGTVGERLATFLRVDQPSRFDHEFDCHDPGFGLALNPTAFVIGNSFSTEMWGPEAETTVNRTEVLANTAWGQNNTYVLQTKFANASQAYTGTTWNDAESGIILRQVFNSKTPTFIAYEEINIIETGIELIIPLRETPSPQTAAVAIAVGIGISVGTSAILTVTGAAQSFNQIVEKLPLPKGLKKPIQLYLERVFGAVRKDSLEALKKFPLLSKRDVAHATCSALILALAVTYVEVDRLPSLFTPPILLTIFLLTLLSVGVVTMVAELLGALAYRLIGVRAEYRFWPIGTIALMVSTAYLGVPFGSPGRSVYQHGDVSKKAKGMAVLAKTMLRLTPLIPFSIVLMLGSETLSDAGKTLIDSGMLSSTLASFFLLLPIWPLEGSALLTYSKKIWAAVLALTAIIFITWTLRLWPITVYLTLGFGSVIGAAIAVYIGRKQTEKGQT